MVAATSLRALPARMAAGLALGVLTLGLLVQVLVWLAVREVTDDYVRRFMAGTVELMRLELAPLAPGARAQRVRELDERFAYPVALAEATSFSERERVQLQSGQMLVYGLNRRVAVALPDAPAPQVLVLGPLDPDWNPEHRLNLPRELWLQLAVALVLAAGTGLAAWLLLRPAWRELRALQRAGEALAAGRFDTPVPALRSVVLRPLGEGLRATLQRLAGALAAQRELTGAVSHELRTPLARLRFALDALVEEDDAHARERAVTACERDIEELETLIDASLTLARLDTGALRAAPQPGDLAALLQREADTLAPLLQGHTLHTAFELPGPVAFDPRLLPYALRNGLRNAARHAQGRIELHAWVEAGTPPRVCVAVDDDGAGVPDAMREAVFEPFRRLDGERERRSAGHGLGLAIVQRVARAHGGEAQMQRAPLGGARLRVSWPDEAARLG
ncbi:MAG: hypothetical protein RI988_78 [Pseudomonadota bacterium]|jgi:two-component system sensor histidine kinase RstB